MFFRTNANVYSQSRTAIPSVHHTPSHDLDSISYYIYVDILDFYISYVTCTSAPNRNSMWPIRFSLRGALRLSLASELKSLAALSKKKTHEIFHLRRALIRTRPSYRAHGWYRARLESKALHLLKVDVHVLYFLANQSQVCSMLK